MQNMRYYRSNYCVDFMLSGHDCYANINAKYDLVSKSCGSSGAVEKMNAISFPCLVLI